MKTIPDHDPIALFAHIAASGSRFFPDHFPVFPPLAKRRMPPYIPNTTSPDPTRRFGARGRDPI
jgi:hypothetical protein